MALERLTDEEIEMVVNTTTCSKATNLHLHAQFGDVGTEKSGYLMVTDDGYGDDDVRRACIELLY